MDNSVEFAPYGFGKRLGSMLKLDLRRLLLSKLFYILIAIALLVPILMNVMLTMMDGTESVDPQTGAVTIIEGPESAWESIGSLPKEEEPKTGSGDTAGAMGGMDVMTMCNINMMFMAVAVFVCLFISEDFRSGYAKNLFSVRAKKGEYVISKTLMGFIVGALMIIAYFIGAMLGGVITGLSFELSGGLSAANIFFCIASKVLLMLVFVPIFVCISVAAKETAWLSLSASLGGGMLLFMMVPMITPLTSSAMNALLCLAGGSLFSFGLGALSRIILEKTRLV